MHEESHSSSRGVQCPLCRSNDLVERNGIVLCPAGDLRLDLRNEGLTLDHVRCVTVTSCPIHMCAQCFKVMCEGHELCAYVLLRSCRCLHSSHDVLCLPEVQSVSINPSVARSWQQRDKGYVL